MVGLVGQHNWAHLVWGRPTCSLSVLTPLVGEVCWEVGQGGAQGGVQVAVEQGAGRGGEEQQHGRVDGVVDEQVQLVSLHVDGGQGGVPTTDEEATLVRGSGWGSWQGGEGGEEWGGEVVDQQSSWLRFQPAPDQLAGLEEEGWVDRGSCSLGSRHQGLHPEEGPGCQGEVVEPTPLLKQS